MMTDTEIKSIRKSFQLLDGHTELFATHFYTRLFELDPSLRMLFHGDMKEQGKKLMNTMTLLNASLDRFHSLRESLRNLGRRHAGYGVRSEHYAIVGAALLQTLEEFAGPKFDATLKQAWTKLLTLVSGEMLGGAGETGSLQTPATAGLVRG
jgi:hemoglobin-like flavoprotein